MDVSILEITDGTTTIDLLTSGIIRKPGVKTTDWKPNIPDYKDGGSWSNSPIADGSIPVFGRRGNVVDTFSISMNAATTDKLAVVMQELFMIIEKGNQYWLGSYSLEPVWIKAQSPCETNARYALVYRAAVPELGFPYSGGFLSRNSTFMRDLTLVIEHGPWCSAPPTQPECIPANTLSPSHYAAYINMEGRYVNCGSDASFDNLADNAFTVDGWFCPDDGDYGGGLSGVLAEKGSSGGTGWSLRLDALWGVEASVRCAVMEAYSSVVLGGFTPDGLWHHIAMTFDDAGDRKIRLWIDGSEPAYDTQNAGNGAIIADAAFNFAIGDAAVSLAQNFHGKVGWVRVSNNRRWTAAFTAPARCSVPVTDANTLGLWGGGGTGVTLYSQEGTTAHNGTITNGGTPVTPPLPVWGWDCDTDFGRESTCLSENFVMSGWQPWQLTHIYHYDNTGAVWSTNLLAGNPPYAILPAAPANGDFIYFGIEGGAPFSNLIFDLSQAPTTSTMALQGHTGVIGANTWAVPFSYIDTTNKGSGSLTTVGVHAITWEQDPNWTVGNLLQIFAGTAPPITARWIRLAVTAFGGKNATQQNRHIYTQTRPHVEIAAVDAPGDIPVDLRAEVLQPKGSNATGNFTVLISDVLMGLRTYDRDADFFQPYINLSDTGNMAHVSIATGGGGSAFADDLRAKTGRILTYTPGGAGVQPVAVVTIAKQYLPYFSGTFRVFLRHTVSGTPVPTAYLQSLLQPYEFRGPTVELTTRIYGVTDLGTISIHPRASFASDMTLYIYFTVTGAGAQISIYDLVLFPVDEMAVRARADGLTLSPNQATGIAMIFDDITYPRDGLTAFLGLESTDAWWAPGYVVTNQPPILQANRRQRLIFMFGDQPSGGNTSCYGMLAAVGLSGLSRYLGLRGAR